MENARYFIAEELPAGHDQLFETGEDTLASLAPTWRFEETALATRNRIENRR